MDCVVQLNILDAGITEPVQRALSLHLHVFDLWVKSKGKLDYRGVYGHRRLIDDAMAFCGTGNPVITKHGDLAAAHLALDYSDTAIRIHQTPGMAQIPSDVSQLMEGCTDLYGLSMIDEKRVGLLMDYLGKKSDK
jgi:hypothetical protein